MSIECIFEMATEIHELLELLEKNTKNMPEADYVKACDLLKSLHDVFDIVSMTPEYASTRPLPE